VTKNAQVCYSVCLVRYTREILLLWEKQYHSASIFFQFKPDYLAATGFCQQKPNTARRPSLAWRAWAHQVQTVYDDAPMPGRHCSTVSGGTLVTSLWDRITTASSFGCQPSTDSAATSADHICRSCICSRWSVDVELTDKTSTWSLFCSVSTKKRPP